MASIRDTLANLVEQYKASDTPMANLMRGDKEGAKQSVANALQQATQDPYSGLNVLGTTKLVGKTAQELKHLEAQKYATEMLGLHPENTGIERAKALEYITPVYHGTNVHVNEFNPNSWFTTEPKYASQYANVLQPNGIAEAPQVIPALLRLGKTKEAQMFTTTDDVMKALGKKNTDSFTLNNVGGGESSHYVIKDPRNIRSINAAFDPRYTGAAAIAAGTASADLLADEDKQRLIDLLKNK